MATTPDAPARVSRAPRLRSDRSFGSPIRGEVPDLAGRSCLAPIQLAAHDEPGADTRTDVQVHEVRDVLAQAEPLLPERRKVHVVLDADLGSEPLLHRLHQTRPAPSGQGVGEGDVPRDRIEDTRAADRREGHLLPAHARLGGEPVSDLADLGDERALAPHPCSLVPTRDDVPGEVRDGGTHVVAADVEADHPPRSRVQLVQDRRRSTAPARPPRLPDEARVDQRDERLRDRRLGQVAVPSDLGPGDGPHLPDELEHRTLVDRLQQARRAGGERVNGRLVRPLWFGSLSSRVALVRKLS